MNTSIESLVDHEEIVEELDFVELGDVTTDTKGNPFGFKHDTGLGWRI